MAKSKKQSAAVATPEPVEAPVKAAKPAKVKKTVAVAVGASLADAFAQSAAFFGKKATYERVEPAPTPEEVAKAEAKAAKREAEEAAAALKASTEKKEKKQKKKDKKRKLTEGEGAVEGETPVAVAVATEGDGAEATPDTEAEAPVSADNGKSDRTIFVGNVSLDATQAALKQFFTPCGKVETVRLRFLPVAGTAVNDHGNQKLMMKVCANKKIFTDKRDFCHAYVTFADLASVEKAMKMNHALFLEKKLRIDHENPVVDPQRSVFVGNLSFHVTDEAVWSFFDKELKTDEEPHPVENVRVIRDRDSGAGKGFGYVLLKGKALAAKALSLGGKKLERRDLRVQVCGKRTKNKKGEDTKSKHEGRRTSAGAGKRVALKRKSQPEAEAEAPAAKKAKFVEGQKATAPGKKLSASAKATVVGKGGKFAGAKPGKKFEGAKSGKKVDGAKPGKKFDGAKGKKVDGKKGKKFDAKGKKGPKVPFVKPTKPKHAARKARQAAEAAASKTK